MLGLIIGFLISLQLYIFMVEIALYKPDYSGEPLPVAPSRIITPNLFLLAVLSIIFIYLIAQKLKKEFVSIEDIDSG